MENPLTKKEYQISKTEPFETYRFGEVTPYFSAYRHIVLIICTFFENYLSVPNFTIVLLVGNLLPKVGDLLAKGRLLIVRSPT
jgi:hypothetical protein